MAPVYVCIEDITRRERHAVIEAVRDGLLAAGGFIVDAQLFSNKAIRLSFELRAGDMPALIAVLASAGVALLDEPGASASSVAASLPPERELMGTIAISFVHDEPDLSIPTPAVPG